MKDRRQGIAVPSDSHQPSAYMERSADGSQHSGRYGVSGITTGKVDAIENRRKHYEPVRKWRNDQDITGQTMRGHRLDIAVLPAPVSQRQAQPCMKAPAERQRGDDLTDNEGPKAGHCGAGSLPAAVT